MKRPSDAGRAWAYVGTIMGVTVSAAANAAETITNPAIQDTWTVGIAVFMGLLPIGLFTSLEVLVRNLITSHLWYWRGAMLVTAAAFATPSYLHMRDLLERAHQNPMICIITPLGWDGMMLLSTLALLIQRSPASQPAAPVAAITAHGEPLLRLEERMSEMADQMISLNGFVRGLTAPPHPAPNPRRQINPKPQVKVEGRQRIPAQQHPLWENWVTDQRNGNPWDVERMIKEQDKIGKRDVTAAAARSMLNRWKKILGEMT